MDILKIRQYKNIINDLKKELEYIQNDPIYSSPGNIKNDRVMGKGDRKDFYDIKLDKIDRIKENIVYYKEKLISELRSEI